jgi:NAD(P)-dependent dehydrogenase (short-subunit alcohol dehydrogenase family)
MLSLNARSAFVVARAVVPHMLAADRGSIVLVGASAALQGGAGNSAYAASKAAVVRLTESLSAETKRRGVRVNAVLPGTIDTPPNRAAMPDADHALWVAPESIADVIAFLASDQARAVTGALIPVYGRR